MHDPFVGTWTLNPARSQFDPKHRPAAGTMRMRLEADGGYLMEAEGLNEKGEPCVEKAQKIVADGQPHPIPDFPGLSTITTRPHANALRTEARREDGSVVGEGTYIVSEDGVSMTATTAGFDTQLRRFETTTVWDRVTAAGSPS